MKVELLGHTQVSNKVVEMLLNSNVEGIFFEEKRYWKREVSDGQVIALAAIRQCYSHKTALEVLETESEKYFGDKGKEGKRLFNHIVKSGHTSTLEHISFTFAVEGVSRALLTQFTRHRQLSFSVQSQRYNKLSSDSRSGGFSYVVPEKVLNFKHTGNGDEIQSIFKHAMKDAQEWYDILIDSGVPQEDARAVLPNAATCNLVTSGNLRSWLEFYKKRKKGNGAQAEIAEFAELIKHAIIEVEPWTEEYFNL